MNDAKIDALERMTQVAIRKCDFGVSLALNLALILRNANLITDAEYEEFKRKCERLEAAS